MEDFYQNLFISSNSQNLSEILNGIQTLVTKQINQELTRPIEVEEKKQAFFSMHSNKSPGIDGTPALFYKKSWHIIGSEVVQAIQSFFFFANILHSINDTLLSLIPKVDNPVNLSQYKPVSLYNVLYKAFSKILANRFKPILKFYISDKQVAFIPERQSLDNILIAHEYLHFFKNKRKGKARFMTLKLDMCKAYDKVEWVYL